LRDAAGNAQQAQDMTRMLAAVAHDLRTPLPRLRLRAEFAPLTHAARMLADIEPMNAMIEQVLGLAVVQGAVRQHGGQLWLLHRRSGGLIGRMQLPVVTAT